jgi:photosystem II stability/assembly factor-like uncharacterized protein
MSVCKTTNGGKSWGTQRLLSSSEDWPTACWDITVVPGDSALVYAGGQGGNYVKVFRSADAGNSWADVTGNLASMHSIGDIVYTIWVILNEPNSLLAGTSKGVYQTTDGGLNWFPTLQIPSIRAFVYCEVNETLYAASEGFGVYCTLNTGSSWWELNDGLECLKTLCLGLDSQNGLLFVGTYGGGIYRLDVSESSPPDTDLDNNGTVCLSDFVILADNWMCICSEPDWCWGSDFDKSGVVDFGDVNKLAQHWLVSSYFSSESIPAGQIKKMTD